MLSSVHLHSSDISGKNGLLYKMLGLMIKMDNDNMHYRATILLSSGSGFRLSANKNALDVVWISSTAITGFLVFYPSSFPRMPLPRHINPAINPSSSRSRQRSLQSNVKKMKIWYALFF